MKEQKTRVLRILMWLLPLVGLALLLVPALNPGRFFSLSMDWTYKDTLTRSMEYDQMFSKAAPGVRPLFAFHAMMIFCCFVPLLGYALEVIGAAVGVAAKKFKALKIGDGILLAGAIVQVLAAYGTISSVLNASARAAELCPQVTYSIPAGSVVIGALGVAQVALFLLNNRARTKADLTYMPMTRTERRENIKGWLFISPFVIGFLVFTAYPLLSSAFASFTYYNITAVQKWYGVRNFTNLFVNDEVFWLSMGNTMYYVLVSVPLVIILALLLALLMNTRGPLMGYFRTIYYLPNVLSGVAVYLLWQWILSPQNGLLNNFLAVFGIKGPAWLLDPKWTKPALIIMRCWSVGGTMILLLAALQNVPQDLYEAGELDGAVGFSKFWHITLPMISPTLFFVMVTGFSGAFQVYDSAYILAADGGPGKSLMFYNLYLFNTAFTDQSMGKASAMAWILFAVIMVFTVIQQTTSKKWVYYEGGN